MDRKPEFFAEKGIKIGIIGCGACGYVGLPLALRLPTSANASRDSISINQKLKS